jgi:ribosome-associated protein
MRSLADREHERQLADADDRDLSSRTDARTVRVAEETALKELAKALVELKPKQLPRLDLPEDLLEAVRFGQAISSPIAFTRHIRVIRQHLRRIGRAPIQARLEALREGRLPPASAPSKTSESAPDTAVRRWLERIQSEGDAALEALFAEHPDADRQSLRQRVRELGKARDTAVSETDRRLQRAEQQLCERLSELVGSS